VLIGRKTAIPPDKVIFHFDQRFESDYQAGVRRQIDPRLTAFTGEGKLVRKATGYKQQRAEPRYPASGSRAERAELPAPLERIGDPQVSSTRQKKAADPVGVAPLKVVYR
jgi:hypothetical protein